MHVCMWCHWHTMGLLCSSNSAGPPCVVVQSGDRHYGEVHEVWPVLVSWNLPVVRDVGSVHVRYELGAGILSMVDQCLPRPTVCCTYSGTKTYSAPGSHGFEMQARLAFYTPTHPHPRSYTLVSSTCLVLWYLRCRFFSEAHCFPFVSSSPPPHSLPPQDVDWMVAAGATYLKIDSCCGNQTHSVAFSDYAKVSHRPHVTSCMVAPFLSRVLKAVHAPAPAP